MALETSTQWAFTASTQKDIDAIFSHFTNSTPGVAMAIYRGSEIVYANGYGMSNLEHNVPITPSSIFHIASISKQFTAMCIALLQDDGLLDVDDPVQKYAPDLPTYEHPITVRHLIHHVSGIRDQWMLLHMAGWREDDLVTEADCFELIKRQQELNFTPNSQYLYSNSGYTLLAMIVKAVSGLTLRQFAHQRIFAPLGMTNTHFHDDHTEIVPGRTQAYEPRDGGGYHISIPPFDVVGTTSLHTTVEDFARWNAHFDAPSISSAEVLEMVQTPGIFNDGTSMTYAWGIMIDEWHGHRHVGHDGADHGYRSSYFRLPEFDFGITVFANLASVSPSELAKCVAEIVLRDHLEQGKDEGESERGAATILDVSSHDIAGTYVSAPEPDGSSMQLILQERDGGLDVLMWDGAVSLQRQVDGTYSFHDIARLWAAEASDDGIVNKVLGQYGGDQPITFTRPDAMDNTALPTNAFAGRYYSPELDIYMQLESTSDTNRLIWKQRKLKDQTIVRIGADTFGLGSLGMSFQLAFSMDENGNPSGFRFSGGRIRNLRFERQA